MPVRPKRQQQERGSMSVRLERQRQRRIDYVSKARSTETATERLYQQGQKDIDRNGETIPARPERQTETEILCQHRRTERQRQRGFVSKGGKTETERLWQ